MEELQCKLAGFSSRLRTGLKHPVLVCASNEPVICIIARVMTATSTVLSLTFHMDITIALAAFGLASYRSMLAIFR